MLFLKVRSLVEKLLNQFFKNITNTLVGSLLFYYIILKGRFGIYRLDSLTGKNIRNFVSNCTSIFASRELKRLSTEAKTMEEIINLGFSFRYSLSDIPSFLTYNLQLVIFQNKYEMIEFSKLIDKLKPKIILEIGTAMGGTLYLLSRFSASKAILISLDLPEVIVGGKFFPSNPSFFKKFVKKKQKIILIRDNSHKFSTLQKIKRILKNRKIDVLFIDGDHTYEGVEKDFEIYKSLVKSGGLICFHDIVPGLYDNVGGVPDFWRKIRKKYNSREIVEDWNQGGFGIGIILVT